MSRKYICPKCKKKEGVPIVYGYPLIGLAEQKERGEIVLGGCCVSKDSPDRQCLACGHEWRIVRRNPIDPPFEIDIDDQP